MATARALDGFVLNTGERYFQWPGWQPFSQLRLGRHNRHWLCTNSDNDIAWSHVCLGRLAFGYDSSNTDLIIRCVPAKTETSTLC